MVVHARLECLKEKITLADEVVEGGDQCIKGTLWVAGGKVKGVREVCSRHTLVSL